MRFLAALFLAVAALTSPALAQLDTAKKREKGLGARLIQEFDEAVAVALEYPDAFASVPEAPVAFRLRWVMLKTFPIKLVYTVRDGALLLVAVFRARHRPGYWLERLRQLGR